MVRYLKKKKLYAIAKSLIKEELPLCKDCKYTFYRGSEWLVGDSYKVSSLACDAWIHINGQGSNANGGNNNKTLQINTEDKSCHLDSNQNHYQQEVMEQYPMEYLKELYHANDMILMGVSDADVEMAMDILYDAVNTTKKTIRVNREDKPSEVVRFRLLKL